MFYNTKRRHSHVIQMAPFLFEESHAKSVLTNAFRESGGKISGQLDYLVVVNYYSVINQLLAVLHFDNL